MDLKLHRPKATCTRTGRGFVPGELMYSAILRGGGGIERIDIAAEAWDGPPEAAIAWWRARVPQPGDTGPSLAPIDVLLDAVEGLDGDEDAAVRYLLALELVRRRVLRIVDSGSTIAGDLVLACRRRDREYRVRPVDAALASAAGVESRLAALLWSGEAA